jgi:hypothetical protein
LGVEEVIVDVLSDEHHLALSQLVGSEGLLTRTEVDLLVHALEDELGVALVGEGEHAFGAVKIGSLGGQQTAHEGVEECHVEQADDGEAHRGDQRQVVHAFLLLLKRGGVVVVIVAVAVIVLMLVLLMV